MDEQSSPISHSYGPCIEFFSNGKVKEISLWGFPKSHMLYYSENTIIYESDLLGLKRFDSKGKQVETIGEIKEFRPNKEMLEILKKEGLLPEVKKYISAPKSLKSILSQRTQNSKKGTIKGKGKE